VQPFEDHLGIRWDFDGSGGVYYPVDLKHPGQSFRTGNPGEPHEGYFSIALMANLGGTGSVLLVAATGGSATNAAADFLADERSLHDLRSRLPAGKSAEFPHFEALVRAPGRSAGSRDVAIVFCRPIPPSAVRN
jgi:hypothetical protein